MGEQPVLSASIRGAAAMWVWRRIEAEADEAPAVLAVAAGPVAARQVAEAIAEIRLAAQQHMARQRADRAAFTGESAKAVLVESVPGSVVMDEITMAEAAELLGKTVQRVGQLRASGKLRGRLVGRSWLIERRSVMDLLDASRSAR